MALMPICFGISFTKTLMNQARALVHVYTDGSVGVSTAGVEMGQGLNTKILQVAAATFSIDPARVKINTTNNLLSDVQVIRFGSLENSNAAIVTTATIIANGKFVENPQASRCGFI